MERYNECVWAVYLLRPLGRCRLTLPADGAALGLKARLQRDDRRGEQLILTVHVFLKVPEERVDDTAAAPYVALV